jgi:prepilin-type N-terminal cleavage/methylation domain-containing protein
MFHGWWLMYPVLNRKRRVERTGLRRGLTLLELMLAMTVSTILIGSLAVLADATRRTSEFNEGQSATVQHARVVFQRINRYLSEAYATETYPGVVVVDETIGSHRHCDTVLIWRPAGGTPANAAGPPLVKELLIICPDPSDPRRLVEITAPSDSRTIQLNEASLLTSSGRSFVSGIKTASTSVKTLLTPLMRTAATSSGGSNNLRAALRFECELHPTTAEMTAYRGGSLDWNEIAWPQGIFSSTFGQRQIWLRSEVQLMSQSYNADGTLPATAVAIPFYGSGTRYYSLQE